MKKLEMKRLEKVSYEDVLEFVEYNVAINDYGFSWIDPSSVLLLVKDQEDVKYLLSIKERLCDEGIALFRKGDDELLIGLMDPEKTVNDYPFVVENELDFEEEVINYVALFKEIVRDYKELGTEEITLDYDLHAKREQIVIKLMRKIEIESLFDIGLVLFRVGENILSVELLDHIDNVSVFYKVEDDYGVEDLVKGYPNPMLIVDVLCL